MDRDLRLRQLGPATLAKPLATNSQGPTCYLTQDPQDKRLRSRWEEEVEGWEDKPEDAADEFFEKAIRFGMSYRFGCHWFMMARTTRILESMKEFETLEVLVKDTSS